MEQVQIEELVAELETRVDRLRSLYEQYFMGIEKMEPHVPRKDVERRFQAMRREQIRNTALRFRFQMVLQKYNTYQSYWMRIMRQIEDGTYKRDVMRARASLGDRRSTRPPPALVEKAKDEKPKEEAPRVASPSMVDDFIFDAGLEEGPTRKVQVPTARAQTKSNADLMAEFSPFDEATTKLIVPAGLVTQEPGRKGLSVDEDPTGILPLIGNPPKARLVPDPEKMRQLAARIKAGAGKVDAGKVDVPATSAIKKPPALPQKAPAATAGVIKAPPAPVAKPPAIKAPAAPPMKPPTAPAAMKALAPPITTAAPKPANSAELSDARVRQIYSQYVETKRKQNESTTAITYEGVAKSLRESTARLKEKHGSNSVDFEVTVKDGKTILRPVLKKDAK